MTTTAEWSSLVFSLEGVLAMFDGRDLVINQGKFVVLVDLQAKLLQLQMDKQEISLC
jgi:hypothetical protein